MAQVQITVTAGLRRPRSFSRIRSPAEYPKAQSQSKSCCMVLNGIKNLGGFFRMSGDSITLRQFVGQDHQDYCGAGFHCGR